MTNEKLETKLRKGDKTTSQTLSHQKESKTK